MHCGHHYTSHNYKKSSSDEYMPSRWYTVLALPFPDQKLGRRDINTFGRDFYGSRAGFFSNPLWVEGYAHNSMCLNETAASHFSSM